MTQENPTYDLYIEPLLALLAEYPSGLKTSQIYEDLATRMSLSQAQRAALLPSGTQPVYHNRIGWAHDRLKRAGLSRSIKRGTWALTQRGRAAAELYAAGMPAELHQAIARPRDKGVPDELIKLDPYEFDGGEMLPPNLEVQIDAFDAETFTAVEAAKIVLAEVDGPLHYGEITRRILERGLWTTSGATPDATIGAKLAVDIKNKGDASDFIRIKPGIYDLNRDGLETASEAEIECIPEDPDTSAPEYISTLEPLSFTDAAERILQVFAEREPMHYAEITDRALDLGLLVSESKNPSTTLNASILQETKRRKERGDTQRFEMLGDGMIGLTRWNQTGLTAYIEAHNESVRRRLHEQLHEMDPTEFEELAGQLLVALGFTDVAVTTRHNDGGIDVRGTLVVGDVIRTKMAVQVKRWKSNIQTPIVQQVRGSLGSHEQGLIITTSDFSAGARAEAERSDAVPVGLMDGQQLVRLLVEYGLGVEKDALNLLRLS
ncbi:HTH domain-containing protein [Bradymonas sediminis]|uniref:Uncharacterized protein n=1 Tax=Bradymonas sediminis TaxID=1548548 RepID=A0A2Z4FNT9_9DELT|nr:HTH domain-containing protein [Bradymonas sediminis]AWV90368.1 hypothetical protein DN745_13935 [Bradymonas sediminis]TDP72248.1 HB1/ASXL restriction endonuclease-like protein with HTH domain [Bradymonas sediminis]